MRGTKRHLQTAFQPTAGLHQMLQIVTFPVGPLDCNCVILFDSTSSEILIVDPGGDVASIQREIENLKGMVTMILITHAHFDHFLDLAALTKMHPEAKVGLGAADIPLFRKLVEQGRMIGLNNAVQPDDPDILIHERTMVQWPSCHSKIEAIPTPGHSPGSVCYYIQEINLLCSGDTLFFSSIGRTDLWEGNFDQICNSIRTELYTLPEDTRVIPGHGPETNIKQEKQWNQFVKGDSSSSPKSSLVSYCCAHL